MARSREMTITKRKFTAADIEQDCPDRLQQMGKQIAARLEKIDKQIVQAENHSISVNQLITQAKELCDEGGFNAFREKFFPNLGKSRVYELLAIGTNKKSIEETKASNRKRQAKHRANKAEAPNSVTVTENSEPEALGAPTEAGTVETTNIAPEQQTPGLSKARGSVSPGDEALMGFSSVVCRLLQIIKNKKPERYAKTSHDPDDLEMIGQFFIAVGIIRKKSQADRPAALMALPDGTVPVGQPAVGPDNAVVETNADLAA